MAMDMFIKIGDIKHESKLEIKGESRDFDHKDEINVLSWKWGLTNSGSAHMESGAGSGKANVQDLSFTKYIDKSSPSLILACGRGTHYPSARLVVRKAGGKPLEYLTIKMETVLITSVSTGGSGGEDRLTENVSLNFARVTMDYIEQRASGGPGDQPSMTLDIPGGYLEDLLSHR
jgi:type VI secretion system secreted protein Hcp